VFNDIAVCLAFYTRLPLPARAITAPALARANWAAPLAGAVVGGLGAAVYWLTQVAGLPALPAAGLAVATTVVATGCLHEDGLADVADGFFGGSNRERRLEIMRDSRIGAYGAVALVLSLLLRTTALAAIAAPGRVAASLIVAHMAARAILPIFMLSLRPARADGLAAGAGATSTPTAIVATTLGGLALGLGLGLGAGVAAMIGVCAAFLFMATLSLRRIGGHTGDVLGALEQIAEIVVLLVAAASA
jgi:adenosylcobinamide-GDP ribazoletransferase